MLAIILGFMLAGLGSLLPSSSAFAAPFKVGLVLDKDGKNDHGYNADALHGVEKANKVLKVVFEAKEAADGNGHETLIRDFAKRHFDLVIALGGARAPALKKVAAEFPAIHFAIIDAQVDTPNVRSILFEEQEGSYLVGALAALMSKTGKIGFIGGMDIPLMHRFAMGYEAGAKKAFPSIKVDTTYIGTTGEAWNNKPRARSMAKAQYATGIDIIFAAAGASNLGVFDETEAEKKFAIGVSNQNWIKPGRILTSMRKRVDIAVFMTCQDASMGSFSAEAKHYGLANQGIDYEVDSFNEKLIPASVLARVNELQEEIIAAKIQVPDYLKNR
jgi:basic membrane protein A